VNVGVCKSNSIKKIALIVIDDSDHLNLSEFIK
jgi:hypothetical protein